MRLRLPIVLSFSTASFFLFLAFVFPDGGGAWIHFLERKTLDLFFLHAAHKVEPDPSVVIVAINDSSLKELEPKFGRWPWPRAVMGDLVATLHDLGVKAVGIDLLYPEKNRRHAGDDDLFVRAVREAGNVVLAADFPENRPPLLPFKELLEGAAKIGGIHLTNDPDGPTRRYRLFDSHEGLSYPSLALAVGEAAGQPISRDDVPLLPDQSYWIRWYGPQGTFPYIQADRVLAARHDPELHEEAASFFKDKIVLIGVTATGLFDLRTTSFSAVYPGVEIHATVLSNLLQSDFIRSVPRLLITIFTLVVSFFTAWLIGRLGSAFKEMASTLLILTAILATGILYFKLASLWFPVVLPALSVFLAAIFMGSWNYLTTGREKKFLRGAFAKYLNEAVLKDLLEHPEKLELGGENRTLTVLFSDIRNFTAISEKLRPSEVVDLLNEYLSAMVEIVFEYGGTLDKFIGDAVMAFWGAPIPSEDHAEKAVRAALAMQKKVEEIGSRWTREGKPPLQIGIGINTAEITVGNIGSQKCQSYTVIGDGVNLASRIESLNKTYGTGILVSESTDAFIRNQFATRFLEDVKVKGKEQSVKIYEVLQRPES